MKKKVALVTGANRGLGTEIARQLATLGMTVIAGARDEGKAKEAAERLRAENLDVQPLKLDVTNAEDVANAVGFISKQFGRLDILVNNAGVGEKNTNPTADEFRNVLEANVVGPYALTEAFIPLLKASEAGRVVNQSSMLGSLTLMSKGQGGSFLTPGYTASKAALNMLTVVHAQLLKDTKVKVNAAHPGWVKTDMGGPGAQLEVSEGAKTAVRLATLDDDGPTGGFFHSNRPMPW